MSFRTMPGSTIGVLGSGQLGRMFAIAARRLGYRVHVLSPDDDTPAGQVADVEYRAEYTDLEAVQKFARGVAVVTFEFENVPFETIQAIDQIVPVRPQGQVLHTTQNRVREKTFLQSQGIPVTPFRVIRSNADLNSVTEDDLPGILKTADWGYDGKGQTQVRELDDLLSAWQKLNAGEAILEKFVDFAAELSIVAVRGSDGAFVYYGPILNTHRRHVLDISIAPAGLPESVSEEAVAIARSIMVELDVVGVLCIEFFLTSENKLLVNELAPRPHNSGHLTIDAHVTCQFEQQVRSVCGLPLGSVQQLQPAAMVNLMGDLWDSGVPMWDRALASNDIKLHLYGKHTARPGRKMGHLTALASSAELAQKRALSARDALWPQRVDHTREIDGQDVCDMQVAAGRTPG